MSATVTQSSRVNGINTSDVLQLVESITQDSSQAHSSWNACTRWKSGTMSETSITHCEIGGEKLPRNFKILIDEPLQLAGTNKYPNPQEYLLAALNACMTVGYVANAALSGIELECLEIESEGDIDLRGFFGLDPSIKAGYDCIHYTVRIKGNATPEQFEKLHQTVMATSPNRFNLSNAIKLTSSLVVG